MGIHQIIPHFTGELLRHLRGNRLESLKPGVGVIWERGVQRGQKGRGCGALPRAEGEEPLERKSEKTGPHCPASCSKRNLRFSGTLSQETSHRCCSQQSPSRPPDHWAHSCLCGPPVDICPCSRQGSPAIVIPLFTGFWKLLRTGPGLLHISQGWPSTRLGRLQQQRA